MNFEQLKELAAVLVGIADGKPWQIFSDGVWRDCTGDSMRLVMSGCHIRLKPDTFDLRAHVRKSFPTLRDDHVFHRDDWTADMLPDGWRPLLMGEIPIVGDQYCSYLSNWFPIGEGMPKKPAEFWKGFWHRTTRPLPVLTLQQVADDWIEWHGGECPVEPESIPEVMFIDTTKTGRKAKEWSWNANGEYTKIIAYRPDPYYHLRQALADGKRIEARYGDEWVPKNNDFFGARPPECYRIVTRKTVPLGPDDVPPLSVIRRKGYIENWHSTWNLISSVSRNGLVCSGRTYDWYELLKNYEINHPCHRDADGNPTKWEPCSKEVNE